MKKIYILNIILFGHFMILSAQNSELIEPMFSPKNYEEPNGTMVSAEKNHENINGTTVSSENDYEKSKTQMWIVYAAKANILSKKNIFSNEPFKSVEMNIPYYVVGEDGEYIRLYRFEKLITYDGKKVLPNHIDNDYGWVNKNDLLLWSKSIKINNTNKVCFKYDGKGSTPNIYFIYNEDVPSKKYLCSENPFIIPNNEIENKTLINYDSTSIEMFSRNDFLNYNQFIESYFKQFEDSVLLNLSYSPNYDKSLYEQIVKKTIIDSFPNYFQLINNDTLCISDSTFCKFQSLNLLDSILIKYTKIERDTFVLNKTNPFIFNQINEELSNRFLLMKKTNNQTYLYLPNEYWKPSNENDTKLTKLYIVENDNEKTW